VILEHKLLYWSESGPIDFDGNLPAVWRPRRYTQGTDLTVVAFGAMAREAIAAAEQCGKSVEVWNPFVLQPLELAPIIRSVEKTGRLLVVQECGATQGLGDQIISRVVRESMTEWKARPKLLAAPDIPVPFAPELEAYCRPDKKRIITSITEMFGER